MNYECPLSKNRLQEEQEELLLKMALVRYFEREDANLRAAVAERPDLPAGMESAEHAVDRAMRQQHWKVVGQKVWRASAKVVTRAAVVFLTFFILLTTAFAASAPVRDSIYKILFSHEDRYTLVQIDPTVSDAFIDADLYTWEHCFAPTYLPEGYGLSEYDDLEGILLIVRYTNGEKFIQFNQTASGAQGSIDVDSENAQITRSIIINNSEGIRLRQAMLHRFEILQSQVRCLIPETSLFMVRYTPRHPHDSWILRIFLLGISHWDGIPWLLLGLGKQ